MPPSEVRAPAGFIPEVAVAFSAAGIAIPVDGAHPLPTSDQPFAGALAITPGSEHTPRRAVAIVCSAAGTVTLKLGDDSQIALPVAAGLSILPFAVKTVVPGGTSAAAAYYNLV